MTLIPLRHIEPAIVDIVVDIVATDSNSAVELPPIAQLCIR